MVATGRIIYIRVQKEMSSRSIDFSDTLDSNEEVRRFFKGLFYSNRRRLVLSIEEAKTADQRQRRIDKTMTMLKEDRLQ